MKVAIITASTAVYKGEQEDASGKVIRKMVEEAGLDVVFMKAPRQTKLYYLLFFREWQTEILQT